MGGFIVFHQAISSPERWRSLATMGEVIPTQPVSVNAGDWEVWWYPKVSGRRVSVIEDTEGNRIIAIGTPVVPGHDLHSGLSHLLAEWKRSGEIRTYVMGQFAGLVIPANSSTLHLFTDSNSVLPLYYRTDGPVLSSSFLSLLRPEDRSQLDLEAVGENMVLGYQTGSRTWVQPIRRLMPADRGPIAGCNRIFLADPEPEEGSRRSFENEVQHQVQGILGSVESLRRFLDSERPILGISSGYDSRLLLGALLHSGVSDLDLFTFFKPNDPDLEIAKRIASAVALDLRIERGMEIASDPLSMARQAFRAFDGRIGVMMQLNKPDYTYEFKNKVLGGGAVQVSGVGGEIYRNLWRMPKYPLPLRRWMESIVLSPHVLSAIQDGSWKERVVERVAEYIAEQVGIDGSRVSRRHQHAYYRNVFLRDWHGIRNGAENRYGHYLPAFVDRRLAARSTSAVAHHGYEGRLEAAMITAVNEELAALSSEYGHSFSGYGAKQELLGFIRTLKLAVPLGVERRLQASRQARNVVPDDAARSDLKDLTENALVELENTQLPIEWMSLVRSRSSKDLFISIGLCLHFVREVMDSEKTGRPS